MADMRFRVKAHSANPTKTVVKARNFEIIVDEPEEMGGTNGGANPVEYILAAFAGCLNVVGHVVAKEMNFELRGIEIELHGDLNPEKFMGASDAERAGYKQITVKVKPDCDADKATLDKWLETMEERCPISDNIQNTTPVKLELK
jgi:uncharacterized OsmC-like protein